MKAEARMIDPQAQRMSAKLAIPKASDFLLALPGPQEILGKIFSLKLMLKSSHFFHHTLYICFKNISKDL